jgi:hypothetical protein
MSEFIPEIDAPRGGSGHAGAAERLNLSGVAAVEVSITVRFHDGRSIEVARRTYEKADEDAAAIVLREIAASKLHVSP